MNQTRGIHVLHVDDEPDFAEVAADMLEREDDRFAVETTTSASEGLDRLAADNFDCVVSDYDMPSRNGIEFLKTVRDDHPNLPFILYTGKGSEEVASEAISAGVTDYLQKQAGPEQYQLLAKRITDAVEHQHAQTSYREIFEKIPDGIVIHDPMDGSFVDMNTQYAEMFGYDRDEFLEAGFEAIHPGDPPYTEENARQRIQEAVDQGSQTFEWPGVTNEGDQFWAEVHLRPVHLHGADRILAVVREITDRKERERELERYKAYVEESTDVIAVFDESGRVKYESPAVTRILGYEQGELIGQNGFDFIHPDDEEEVYETFAHLISDPGATATAEYRFRTADGQWCWLEARGTNHLDTDPINGIVTNNRDITDRKEREEQLQRQNERLEKFTSIVSHDLRNPLNVAQGRLELAQDECDSHHLDGVAQAHERMGDLIEDMLTLAREGEQVSEVTAVELADMIEGCWRNVETNTARLTLETTQTIHADPDRLKQLLENLFRNAVEHGGEDVTITVGDLDDRDGFYVADDGPGISADKREQVFDAGYSTTDEGTGFGLNIVREIAEAHGWDITVTDGEVGGARFEITGVHTDG